MELKYYTTLLPQIFEGAEIANMGHIHVDDLDILPGGGVMPRKIPARRFLVTVTVQEDDSSYRHRALMDKTQLVLKFSLPHYIDLPIGTWCDYMGQRFYLGIPANFKKQGTRKFEYTLNMGTLENGMADYKLRNSVDGRLKWSMCAKPHEFIEEIVRNLNERDGEGVWSVGDCIDSTEKTIEFNHSYIDAALQSVADTFETEWEIAPGDAEDTFIINLHKVEHFKDDPLALSYGRGNGFVPGVGRTSKSDEKPIKRLYTEGTDRNIDRSKYGEAELRLPRSKSLTYDGTHFEGEKVDGVVVALNPATSRTYETDPAGTYIERTDMTSQAVKEDSLDCSEIYPSRIGKVSDWVCVNADKNFYDLVDNSIPDDLDFDQYQIAGETMTIIFQSGMLAGKEFEVSKYSHRPKTVNGVQKQGKRFEIVPQEYDGVLMPNDTFKPKMGADGDTYAVFGIQLPEAYICNDSTKEGASWDMFKEAVKFLYEHEEQKFTFAGELQGIWAKRNWLRVGSHLKVGGYVLFRDDQFAKDGTLIRITGIKDFLTSPYSPTIEISNSVGAASTASQQLREIEATEVVISDTKRSVLEFTKRRFRDAKETMSMLQSALQSLSDEYTDAVSPIAVKTMQVLLGDESLQFQFVRGLDNLTRIDDTFGYDQVNKVFGTAGVSYIQHLTLGINNISSQHEAAEFKKWMLPKYESPALGDGSKSYYVYAVCKQEAQTGYFTLSETPLILQGRDADHDDCYNLLCGVLNSEYDGERSFVPLYGFTEILPGRITTDRVVSADGQSYFDLAGGVMKLGDCLIYNLDGDNTLHLKFLTSENSNLGGWIFRDNLLISQKGSVGGNEADYNDIEPDGRFPGGVFTPNIALDAVFGKIMQADNLVIDDDGISLLNERGEVAALITNNTIGDIGDLANAADTRTGRVSLSNRPQYLPYGGGAYRQTLSVGIINVGFLSDGSTVTHNNSRLEFKVPSINEGQTGGNSVRCVFAQMQVDLYRGSTKITSLGSMVMISSHDAGQTVVLTNSTQKTITIGGDIPEGNYTIRMTLMFDLLGQHSAVLTNLNVSGEVNYSFSKYGFQRTVLGNDGFYTSWAQNQYIFANAQGITLRHGNAVIKLSGDGLQKSTNGGNSFSAL